MPITLLLTAALVVQAAAPPTTEALTEAYHLFLQSRRLEQRGDARAAVESLRRALTLTPGVAELHAELAAVFAREGRAAEAVTAAEAALAIEAGNREAHRTLAFVQAAVADAPAYASTAPTLIKEAIGHLEAVLAVPVSDPGARYLLGRLYDQSGQFDKAVGAFRALLVEQPGHPEVLLALAESAERAEKWEDAAGAWDQIVELGSPGRAYRPRQARALVKMGDQQFALKRYKDAASAFDRALASDRSAIDAAEVTRKRDRARELAGK